MSVSRTVFGLYISILSVGFFVVFLIPLLIFLFLMIYYPYGTNLLLKIQKVFVSETVSAVKS